MFVHITEDDYNEDTDECDEDNTTRLELCMSYKETKQHRNNLAKLAIISSEQYGISLPIHFSPVQFILAAMNDLDH